MAKMELECQAVIKKVDLTAKLKKSVMVRLMRIRLEREFDPLMARAIGGDAQDILGQLKTRSQEKAIELNIGAGGPKSDKDDRVVIPSCVGRKATATAPAEDDEDLQPTILLEFAFDEKAWAWFGRNCGGYADVSIGAAQKKLALAGA